MAGPALMLVGMLMFSLNDAMGKWLVASYSVGQVLLIRSVAALVILAPFLWKAGLKPILSAEKPRMQAARVFFSTFEVFAFYYAVISLPLADVMTYWLAAPIYVAAASPFLLGERVGWRRWTAIAIGFAGVLIALNPSRAMFTPPAIVSILGTLAFAFMMISGRSLRGTPDRTLVFFQLSGALVAGLVVAPFDWRPLGEPGDVALMLLLGVVAMSAHMLVNRALKISDAATVAPLQYTLLLWAILFGWLFFGDLPKPAMLAGAALIVGSGLFIFFREQQLKRRKAA
ncbi:DMT family transporter [Rhizobiaceae bacterium BDR2-2]|uniref:DMT family transporter n=2 Tax=Ectorhizobium quercum TaxID=2965071 RepID=A0AAE3N065_9HYPH|nr:DMT family transporter [Ectorhizobium quercum]MCX8998338.1 DMT family transporter [Ectorhizobium quercum]